VDNAYRIYSGTTVYTGNYKDASGEKFSGKPTLCGNYLVATRHHDGKIFILDISDITAPEVIHTIDIVGNADIAHYDEVSGCVYIPLGNQGFIVINLSTAFNSIN
jgi:hypothetical protein